MKKHKQNTKTHKVAKIVGLSFLGLVILLIAFLFWALAPRSTKDIERVASMFVAPSDWKETIYRVNPPKPLCIGDVACPYLDKRWEAPGGISQEKFENFTRQSGVKVDDDGDTPCSVVSDGERLCVYRGVFLEEDNQFRVSVWLRDDVSRGRAEVSLFIQKEIGRD